MKMFHQLRFGTIALAFVAFGCSQPQAGGPSGLASISAEFSLDQVFSVYQKAADSPQYLAAVTGVGSSNIMSFYKDQLAEVSNAGFSVGQHRFGNLKDFLVGLGPDQKAAEGSFGTYEKYWKSLGINSKAKVSVAEYNDGLTAYERLVDGYANTGELSLSADEVALVAKMQMVDIALGMEANKTSSLALLSVTTTPTSGPQQPPASPPGNPRLGGTTYLWPQITINGGGQQTDNCHRIAGGLVTTGVQTCGSPDTAVPTPQAGPTTTTAASPSANPLSSTTPTPIPGT